MRKREIAVGTQARGPASTRPSGARLAMVFLATILVGFYALVLVRTAWVCDDAYITFRAVDNWVHGYGLRWNVAERVQSYTHPLWMLVVAAVYRVTGEAYFSVLALSIGFSVTTVSWLARRVAPTSYAAVLGVTVLVCSRAFVDYSTSGLENPLTHLLLVAFFVVWWRRPATTGTAGGLAALAALLMVTRLDSGLLVLPALAAAMWRTRTWRVLLTVAAGLTPVLAWELFSLVYYGFPFPNTAYAKLSTGVPPRLLAGQGLTYLLDAVSNDPLTVGTVLAGLAAAAWRRTGEHLPLALGVCAYLAYIVWIGGDFMGGRFLAAPMLCSLMLLVRAERTSPKALSSRALPLGLVVALGLAAPRPTVTSGMHYAEHAGARTIPATGITDERAFYYRETGLLGAVRGGASPVHEWGVEGRRTREAGTRVVARTDVGFFGYFAGPLVHVIDQQGLADPLLARLPARARWRIGHFSRTIPVGYVETVATGRNVIQPPGLAEFYRALTLVTRGPIWERRRFAAIWALNTHRFDDVAADYRVEHVTLSEVSAPVPNGTAWDAPGTVHWAEIAYGPAAASPGSPSGSQVTEADAFNGVAVDLGRVMTVRRIELALSGNDVYDVVFLAGSREVGRHEVRPASRQNGGLVAYELKPSSSLPPIDHVRIRGWAGDYRYSVGRVLIRE